MTRRLSLPLGIVALAAVVAGFAAHSTPGARASVPAPTVVTMGNVDCDGDVDAVDALGELRFVAGLLILGDAQCPRAGNTVALDAPTHRWGDVDCDNDVDSVDALKTQRHVASLTVSQHEPCPDIGTDMELHPFELSLDSVQAQPGDTVSVNLNVVAPEPGVAAYDVHVVYDASMLTAVSCASLPGGDCNAAFSANTVAFAGVSLDGIVGDASLGSITFAVGQTAGSASLLVQVVNLLDPDVNAIFIVPGGGTITIR